MIRHLFTPALLFAAAIVLGLIVQAGILTGIDTALFKTIALRKTIDPDWMISLAQWTTWLGDGTQRTLAAVALAAWLIWERRFKAALVVGVMMPLASVASSILKMAFDRPRPDLVPHLDKVHDLSFPSGHAAAGAALLCAALLLANNRRGLWLMGALLVMASIGISRTALGVHWPSDVVGGWLNGLAFALAAVAIVRHWER
jgi:undecaprenyl-diphosphatase